MVCVPSFIGTSFNLCSFAGSLFQQIMQLVLKQDSIALGM